MFFVAAHCHIKRTSSLSDFLFNVKKDRSICNYFGKAEFCEMNDFRFQITENRAIYTFLHVRIWNRKNEHWRLKITFSIRWCAMALYNHIKWDPKVHKIKCGIFVEFSRKLFAGCYNSNTQQPLYQTYINYNLYLKADRTMRWCWCHIEISTFNTHFSSSLLFSIDKSNEKCGIREREREKKIVFFVTKLPLMQATIYANLSWCDFDCVLVSLSSR